MITLTIGTHAITAGRNGLMKDKICKDCNGIMLPYKHYFGNNYYFACTKCPNISIGEKEA